MTQKIQERLRVVPDRPGVYLHLDASGEVLYVGKASSLRNRVRSYFQKGSTHSPRIERLVRSIKDIEWIVVGSEQEALILESNLIKKHRPKFNVVLRDDKHFPYLKLSLKDKYPRVSITRQSRRDGHFYVGPFSQPSIARRTLKMVPKYFQVATCREVFDGKRRPCLYYHLDQCLAPCAGKTTPEEYGEAVKKVEWFLQGKFKELEKELTDSMLKASEAQKYEEAARHRDAIDTIQALAVKQNITSVGEENQDYFAHHHEGTQRSMQVFQLREGRLQGRHEFFFDHVELSDEDYYATVLTQYYSELDPPSEIFLPTLPAEHASLESWLTECAGRVVRLHVPQRGQKLKFLKMVQENAVLAFEGRFRRSHSWAVQAAEDLADACDLDEPPMRIECFDISHLQGSETVASMVVWQDGQLQKREYRKFNIRTVEGPDDFGSMAEVVIRRYKRLLKEDQRLPDLVLIDGGAGQRSAAVRALAGVGLPMLNVVALAKREEELYVQAGEKPLKLEATRPALQLVQRIRDEAHRFAVSHHRKRRSKRTIRTRLTEIPGVGPKTAQKLLKKFGSYQQVMKLSEAELVPEIGEKLTKSVMDWKTKNE